MDVDRNGFQSLVADMALDKSAVTDICAHFEPFFSIVEHGAYDLREPVPYISRDASDAVRLLLVDDEAQVCPFSVSRPFAAPSWMTDETYVASVRNSLKGEALGSEFLMRIVAGKGNDVARQRVVKVMQKLHHALPWENFTQGLNAAATATFRARFFDADMVRKVQTGVQDFLRTYLLVALVDAGPWQKRLAPVIAVLPACIPYSRISSPTGKKVITLFA